MKKRIQLLFSIFSLSLSCIFATTSPQPASIAFDLQLQNKGETTIYFCTIDETGNAVKLGDSFISFEPVFDSSDIQTTAQVYLYWSIFENTGIEISIEEREINATSEQCWGLSTNNITTPGRIIKMNYTISAPEYDAAKEKYSITIPESFKSEIVDHVALDKTNRSLIFSYPEPEDTTNAEYNERSSIVKLVLELTAPKDGTTQAFMKGVYNGYLIAEMKSI